MKKINRREFAKLAGGAAIVPLAALMPPLVGGAAAEDAAPAPLQEQSAPPKPDAKPKLTPEQEEAVKKAVERRERQLATMRSHALPYDAEPAFVFSVRQHPRAARKP